MNLLDENIRRDQRELLTHWSIRFREIGNEIGRLGVEDDEIVRLLHGLKSVTFFTLDSDFYNWTATSTSAICVTPAIA